MTRHHRVDIHLLAPEHSIFSEEPRKQKRKGFDERDGM